MSKSSGEAVFGTVRASYGLSPMQNGMLFEALLHGQRGEAAGYNIEQLHMVFAEALDAELLGRAFTSVARRHPVLSSAFRWEGIARPIQEVHADVVVPVERHALDAASEPVRDEALRQFLARDRARGFDLRAAPLMRVSVLGASPERTDVVWTFHHILLDGRSFPIVLREVFAAYRALARDEVPELGAPPRAYAEFIAWLDGRDLEQSRAYFRALLAGKPAPTPLPIAEPAARPLPRSGRGDMAFAVPPAALHAAEAIASATGATLATVVQAAWALVLRAFTQDEDVVFGSTRSCRRSALGGDTAEMVGLFMNTLPLRARLGDERSAGELLRDLRQQSVALRAHEHTPLNEAQTCSEVARGCALFETFLMFEDQDLGDALRAAGGGEWQGTAIALHEQPSLPLSVLAVRSQAGLELRLLFDKKRFTDESVARVGASFVTAVEQLGGDPERRLSELDVLPAAERRRIVYDWNDTARPFPDDLCIHEPFERRADAQPTAPAVEFGGETLSYADLEARANKLAQALRQRGARPGVYVGLCLSRGFDLVVTLLGIAKSGAAYLPLDPDHPRERLAFMVEDAAALMVVTEKQYEALFSTPTLVLDGDDRESIAAQSPARLPRLSEPGDVCYVIFTSGSTGQPKGVVLSHRAVINTFDWVTRTFEIGPGDRLLFVTSPCFDLSVYDTFGALGAGATVVVADRDTLRDPAALAAAIGERRITVWDSAPAALQRLVPFFPPKGAAAPLRRVMLSGDWIPLSLPDAIRASFPNAEVKSLGGATEAAIWSNWFPVGAVDPRWASIPYGRPIQNARYHVLDAKLRPVPVGVPGDLYIGGACLAEGYLNRAELTAERFIADPFRSGTGERLYKTGDLARYVDSGDLEFLGRSDFQVKIRGYRVEMGEVEIALRAVDGVRDAICAAYVDASGQKSLAAYVVAEPLAVLDGAEIKARLGKRLPDYMVPSVVMVLDAMPLSCNGKVDRKALPPPTTIARTDRYQPPRTDLERALLEIWERVLKRAPIGVHDNFFDLGGHSMLAVTMMSEIQSRLGFEVPLSRIIECPTIEALAASQQAPGDCAGLRESLVQVLRPGGDKPFFFVHDGDGEILLYLNLAKRLPPEFSAYGITPLRQGDIALAHTCLKQMAACYLQQVRKLQPEGPYRFAGLCAGGVLAFEMARQLEHAGERVELLAILDAAEPSSPRRRFIRARQRFERMARRWRPSGFGCEDRARDADAAARAVARRRPRLLAALAQSARAARNVLAHEANALVHELSVGLRFRLLQQLLSRGRAWPAAVEPLKVREIYTVLRDQYVPEPTRVGSALLVRAAPDGVGREEPASLYYSDPLLGWRRHVRDDLRVVDAPGGHASMLQEPAVAFIADALASYLGAPQHAPAPAARAQAASEPPPAVSDTVATRG
jgi:amino acid adenylation domain-containing protein